MLEYSQTLNSKHVREGNLLVTEKAVPLTKIEQSL